MAVKITEVRVKLMDEAGDRLRAFCSITFDDCFVVRDLKIIEGTSGPFVAMPSRKLTSHCAQCGCKNHLRANYCNQCGRRLAQEQTTRDEEGRAKLYADIAHPINSACREMIQEHVISAYEEEKKLADEPGYRSRYDDYFDAGEEGDDYGDEEEPPRRDAKSEHTHVESAESEPRPPHTPRSDKTSSQDQPPPRKFGEGIFE